jgi:endoglucanase
VISAIRPIDPDNLIVLGTPRWSQLVSAAAASPVRARNLLYTLHFYSCTHSSDIRSQGQAAIDAGQAVFVTEWGATDADGGMDGRVCADAAEPWLEWMESEGISWTAWKWDDCVPDSTCILTPGAPVIGSWSDEQLRGHAPFVREWMERCDGFSVCNDG